MNAIDDLAVDLARIDLRAHGVEANQDNVDAALRKWQRVLVAFGSEIASQTAALVVAEVDRAAVDVMSATAKAVQDVAGPTGQESGR